MTSVRNRQPDLLPQDLEWLARSIHLGAISANSLVSADANVGTELPLALQEARDGVIKAIAVIDPTLPCQHLERTAPTEDELHPPAQTTPDEVSRPIDDPVARLALRNLTPAVFSRWFQTIQNMARAAQLPRKLVQQLQKTSNNLKIAAEALNAWTIQQARGSDPGLVPAEASTLRMWAEVSPAGDVTYASLQAQAMAAAKALQEAHHPRWLTFMRQPFHL